jgi:hypothetical protein
MATGYEFIGTLDPPRLVSCKGVPRVAGMPDIQEPSPETVVSAKRSQLFRGWMGGQCQKVVPRSSV